VRGRETGPGKRGGNSERGRGSIISTLQDGVYTRRRGRGRRKAKRERLAREAKGDEMKLRGCSRAKSWQGGRGDPEHRRPALTKGHGRE